MNFENIKQHNKEKKYSIFLYKDLNFDLLNNTKKLSQILFKNDFNYFLKIAINITKEIKKLHDSNILHGNISNDFIFVEENNNTYVFNFQYTTTINKKNISTSSIYFKDINIEDKSPEQLGRINATIDLRSDLYNLGLVFYKMLFNKNPFKGKNNLNSLNKVLTKNITNEKSIPKNIFSLISKLLKKEVSFRYQSIEGLLYDLKLLQKDYYKNIDLGSNDTPKTLQISDKIYGREEELKLLINNYNKVCKSDTKVTCIGGYSGVGKTALINKLKNKIASTNTYCISSKFDQYNKGKPYFGIKEAFETLAKQILLKPKDEFNILKENILYATSNNGKILTDLVPTFENIIGKQEELQDLPSNENENRFHQFFISFLKTIATRQTPLVLIVDDLQWIDFATLKLLESFINSDDLQYFYLLCSYRDNEIEGNIALQNFLQNHLKVETIKLNELNKDSLSEFLQDTLYSNKNDIKKLMEEVYKKTGANPFFFKQFIFDLYNEGLIYFDNFNLKWLYNIKEIKNQNITENVAEYILKKGINSLDKESIKILQIASILGSSFELKTLQKIVNIPFNKLIKNLENIFDSKYLLLINSDINHLHETKEYDFIKIKFVHDQIQQAAYLMINKEELLQLHYDIGKILLDYSQKEINYFDVLSHLNFSKQFFKTKKEKLELIELNKKALYLAKSSTAYNSALEYTQEAKNILHSLDINEFYDLHIELTLNFIELLYLTNKTSNADQKVNQLFNQIKDDESEVKLRRLLTIQYTRIGRLNEAVEEGTKSLSLLDLHILKKPTMTDVSEKIQEISLILEKKPFSKISKLPQIKDPKILKILDVLMEMQAASYNSGSLVFPITILELLRITILNGNSYFSSYIYMMYALMNTKVLKNYDMAFEASKYAEELQLKLDNNLLVARLNMMNSNFIMPWKNKVKESSFLREKAFNQCINCGDYYWGIHSLIFGFYSNFIVTESLDRLLTKTKNVAELSKKIEQISQYYLCNIQINLIKILNGETSYLSSLNNYTSFEKKALKEYEDQNYMCGKYDFIIAKLMHGYLYEDYENALKISLSDDLNASSLDEGIFHEAFYKIFNILTILSIKADGKDINKYDNFITENIKFIDIWQKYSPDIFSPIKFLIEALNKYLENDINNSMKYYEKAIKFSQKSNSIFLQAILNEEYAKFWIRRNNNKIADIYFNDALLLYKEWKAFGKVAHLESKIVKNFYTNEKNSVDVDVIISSSQIISKEIELEKLIHNILNLVIRLSGAINGFIFFKEQNQNILAKLINKKFTYCTDKKLLNKDSFPKAIISYVQRTKQITLINDTENSDIAFKDDYIIHNKPKSILSIPLILNNEVKSVIYLENFEGNNIFLEKDIEMIKHLSSQIILSIENSFFYKELEKKVEARTKELEYKNRLFKELAITDNLTKLYNRNKLDDVLTYESNKSNRFSHPFGVILIDIDHFKSVNDIYGHQMGDTILIEFANILKKYTRKTDTVGRWGGEEFLIICSATDLNGILTLAQYLKEKINSFSFSIKENKTASFGISCYEKNETINNLIKRADNALYKAKENGRNQIEFL